MASYDNPPIRDGINVTAHSTLGEFAKLCLALAVGIVLLVVALTWGFRWIAPWIPFRFEQAIAAPVLAQLTQDNSHPAKQQYLQNLADSLAPHMDFPADMPVHLHWSSSQVPNAFATLGGHITIHQGLIDSVHSENGLAMVLAHELAHVRQRDPLVSLGSGLVLSSSMALLLGSGSDSLVGRSSAALTSLQFSRRQEQAADAAALDALQAHYGHLQGADEFFTAMKGQGDSMLEHPSLAFLHTHPGTLERAAGIVAAAAQAQKAQPNQLQTLTPLPAFMQSNRPPAP